MAKKKGDIQEEPSKKPSDSGVVSRNITDEMKEAYLDYAMSVITGRALPDVRDGLKPVHRRILFSMSEMGLTASAKTRKSAAVVGEVLGKYHPHGDTAVYDSLVKMTQDFSMRYPLIIGQGNFGSIDGDNAAAPRYTEAKMSRISAELLRDIGKDTVLWTPNYENNRKEPSVLPAVLPNLLLNGTLGIAVGMATNIPPHNLREVVDATMHLIDNDKVTNDDLLHFVKGPDFPTGATAFNQKDIAHAYANGKGGVLVRGQAEIVENKKGNFQIVISSIPYRVNKSELIVKIADLVRDKKIDGIKDIRDESTKDIQVVVELKSTAQPQKVLNYLYKHTQLEDTFHYNMVALVDGVPQTLSLKGMLEEFVKHRRKVTERRLRFELSRAEEREHILLGLKKALDHIDAVIKTIKASKDATVAHVNLMKQFKFSDKQATAILEMRLQKLAGLERKKIDDELKEIQVFIADIKGILASEKKIFGVIKKELVEVGEKYGDERRTKIIKSGVKMISAEDMVPDEESVLVLTKGGYIKRTNPDEYKKQRRGGVGVVDLNTKEEDIIMKLVTTSMHSDILFFTDKGKVYQIKMYELPEGKRATKGKSIVNFLSLDGGEYITSVLAMTKEIKTQDIGLLMVTKQGISKKVSASSFHDVRRSGLIAIKLNSDDELISASFVDKKDSVVIVTKAGQAIRFKESDVREMGRGATGVRAIKLGKDDVVVNADVVSGDDKEASVLVLTENGFGKKTPIKEYKVQKRGGSGIKTAKLTAKTGRLISANIVNGDTEELVAISKKGQVIRTGLDEISSLGRQTQGVKVMKLRAGDALAALVCF